MRIKKNHITFGFLFAALICCIYILLPTKESNVNTNIDKDPIKCHPSGTITGCPTKIQYFPGSNLSYSLVGSPPGGTFTGPGIRSNIFMVEVAGPGSHSISYVYANVCGIVTKTVFVEILVLDFALPTSFKLNNDFDYDWNLQPTVPNGIWSVSAVAIQLNKTEMIDDQSILHISSKMPPPLGDMLSYELSVKYTVSNHSVTKTTILYEHAELYGSPSKICKGGDSYKLYGIPPGGSFRITTALNQDNETDFWDNRIVPISGPDVYEYVIKLKDGREIKDRLPATSITLSPSLFEGIKYIKEKPAILVSYIIEGDDIEEIELTDEKAIMYDVNDVTWSVLPYVEDCRFELRSSISPATWTGPGVKEHSQTFYFYPGIVGPGKHNITCITEINGCRLSKTIEMKGTKAPNLWETAKSISHSKYPISSIIRLPVPKKVKVIEEPYLKVNGTMVEFNTTVSGVGVFRLWYYKPTKCSMFYFDVVVE